MKRKEKGITLIALIVTIVILVILTAITITNVMNADLFGLARGAVENYIKAGEEEQEVMDDVVAVMEGKYVSKDSKVKAGQVVDETEVNNYTDVTGKTATIPAGFKVSTNESEQLIDDGLVIQDEEGNEFVWVPCYVEEKPEGTASNVQKYARHVYAGTETKANDILSSGSLEDTGEGHWKTLCYTVYWKNWEDEATKSADSYGNKSVSTYGGFYVGRYEAGLPEDMQPNLSGKNPLYESTIERNNISNKKPISKPNNFSWNFICQSNAKLVSEAMYEEDSSVYSKLIDRAAWDTIVNWISSDGTNVTESSSYGNYQDTNKSYDGWYTSFVLATNKSGATYTGWLYPQYLANGNIQLQHYNLDTDEQAWQDTNYMYKSSEQCDTVKNYLDRSVLIPTGAYRDFKLKNIYDLAGNLYEWTTEVGDKNPASDEVVSGNFVVCRGGGFTANGTTDSFCFCYGGYDKTKRLPQVGFRVVLYVR